jgi:hypothetical protein
MRPRRAGTARRRIGAAARQVGSLGALLCASAGFAAAPTDSRITFTANTPVPRPVQEFAWRVIETRCNYQSYEREQRSFFAYDARATRVGAGVVYSISIRADATWRRIEPPTFIEMTVIDDGTLRLTALRSSFAVCVF